MASSSSSSSSSRTSSSAGQPQPEDQQPYVRPPGCQMRKDFCYSKYEQALQCLDRNDYQHDQCAEAFHAFKDCRGSQMKGNLKSTFETDPFLGWAFSWVIKTYSQWSDSREAAQQQLLQEQLKMQQQLEEKQQQAQEQQQQQQPPAEDRKPWWRKPRQQQQQ